MKQAHPYTAGLTNNIQIIGAREKSTKSSKNQPEIRTSAEKYQKTGCQKVWLFCHFSLRICK